MVKVVSIEIENAHLYGSLVYDDALEVVEDAFLLSHNSVIGVQRFGWGGVTRCLDIGLKDR